MAHIQVYMSKRSLRTGRKQYRWRMVARNGRIMATGAEGYNNLGDLWHAIAEIRKGMGVGLEQPIPVYDKKPRVVVTHEPT